MNKELLSQLATEAHTTTRCVISIFCRRNKIRYALVCFQNVVFYMVSIQILNSSNSIDKVNFNIIISKNLLNFFLGIIK
jgi:hypothetical protein